MPVCLSFHNRGGGKTLPRELRQGSAAQKRSGRGRKSSQISNVTYAQIYFNAAEAAIPLLALSASLQPFRGLGPLNDLEAGEGT